MKNLKAIEAAIKAGEAILEVYNGNDFGIEMKDDKSPLTLADKMSHERIDHYLKDTDYPVVSEESDDVPYDTRKAWTTYWLVDPLDGTKEFINKNGEFTVNIALIDKQLVQEGIVYVPVRKELYFTNEGKSYKQTDISTYEDFDLGKAQQLEPKKVEGEIRIVASKSHMNDETEKVVSDIALAHPDEEIVLKSVGSSLKLCLVAEGEADFYPRYAPTMEWDIAAGHAICKGAGVPVVDADTKTEVVYNKENMMNPWFEVGTVS